MFQTITSTKLNGQENVIIMGYNTWSSISKPLKNRMNIIISKNHMDELKEIKGIFSFENLEACFQFLRTKEYGRIFIIGGSSLYEKVYNDYYSFIDLIYQTEFNHSDGTNSIPQSKLDEYNTRYISINMDTNNNFIKIKEKRKVEEGEVFDFQNNQYISKEITYSESVYQLKENINFQEYQYLDLLKDILENGIKKDSRNSTVYSSFGSRMKFDLREGFPLLTTKKMPWKTILRELLWFIKGSTSNKELQDKNVHIWDANASKEFLKTRGLSYEEGDLGPIYGFQWRHFGAKYKDHMTDYQGQGIDQLQWIIHEIQTNPMSRRLIMSSWNPVDLDRMALPPCHIMIQFNIEDKYIDAQLYQRSGDMFLGVPFNISSYAFLLHIIGKITGYIPRYFIHIIGDTHIYEDHIDSVKEQLLRIPSKFPSLEINSIDTIDTIQEDNLKINNYQYYPTIQAKMVA
tara:strand:+ start:221 stop:1597 length:1377 start_codon:yes stop_codon:yes gene_type:complete